MLAPTFKRPHWRLETRGLVNVPALGLSRLLGSASVEDGGELSVDSMPVNMGLFKNCCFEPLGKWACVND